MPKVVLTEKWLTSPPKAEKGKRIDYSDIAPNLVVRVNHKGVPTFVFLARFPGKRNPSRRTLGAFDIRAGVREAEMVEQNRELPRPPTPMSLARARQIASEWSSLVGAGIDPGTNEKKMATKALERAQNTFEHVARAYIDYVPSRKRNRHAAQDARVVQNELLERRDRKGTLIWRNEWADKPIADVTDEEIADLILQIRDRPAPALAYEALSQLKAVFRWAMFPQRKRKYGLSLNVAASIMPTHFELSKTVRLRVLNDAELRAYWEAADNTPYPYGPFFKALLLNGQRRDENAGAKWGEFDLKSRDPIWVVPQERFKSGQDHPVPISPDLLSLLNSLPRPDPNTGGNHVFSTTNGVIPINSFGKAKRDLNKAMLEILRRDDPNAELPRWVLHDVRRTVRTRLSALKVHPQVSELIIGHGKVGLLRVYDQYEFEREMREALNLWASKLREIIGINKAV